MPHDSLLLNTISILPTYLMKKPLIHSTRRKNKMLEGGTWYKRKLFTSSNILIKRKIVARNVYKIQVDILREVDDLFNIKFSLLFTNIELL